jgi:stage V sporulation protein G
MEITEVKVFPIQEEKLKAFVSIVFDQCFMVNDIKIIQGRDGLFISMPSRKKKNGEFKDVAHPLNNETRRMIEDQILAEYERVLGERGERLPAPPAAAPRNAVTAPALPSEAAAARPVLVAAPAAAAAASTPAMPAAAAVPATPAVPANATDGHDGKAGHPGDDGRSDQAAAPPAAQKPPEKTLEEIEEMHLRDSFWTVT